MTSYTSTHCEHGTYIGGPLGPDYLCGHCEQGISAAELAEADKADDHRNALIWDDCWDKAGDGRMSQADCEVVRNIVRGVA